jgi:hypothetical protein
MSRTRPSFRRSKRWAPEGTMARAFAELRPDIRRPKDPTLPPPDLEDDGTSTGPRQTGRKENGQ